jgi:hypothetical protein
MDDDAAEQTEAVQKDQPEDLRRGFSLLRELAASDDAMVEIAPGVWRVQRAPGDSWF